MRDLNVSRIGFTDEFFFLIEIRMQRAFQALRDLEKGRFRTWTRVAYYESRFAKHQTVRLCFFYFGPHQKLEPADSGRNCNLADEWELMDPQSTLLLSGRTGNGRSKTGNKILGSNTFKSGKGTLCVTETCETQSKILEDGRHVKVIDTPAWSSGHLKCWYFFQASFRIPN